jgi:hypothetical protein
MYIPPMCYTYPICTTKVASRAVFMYIPLSKRPKMGDLTGVCTRNVTYRGVTVYIPPMCGTYPVCTPLGETGTAASGTRLGGYRLRLLPGVVGTGWTEGTAAGVYHIRRLRNNPCTSSVKGLMQGLPVAHFGQRKGEMPGRAGHDGCGREIPGQNPGIRGTGEHVPQVRGENVAGGRD